MAKTFFAVNLVTLFFIASIVANDQTTQRFFCGNGRPRSEMSKDFGRGLCSERYYQCPKCHITETGYRCQCGTGYSYRPKNSMCVATSLDSSIEFKRPKNQTEYPSYTELLGISNNPLQQFTMSFRIMVTNSTLPGTVLSYDNKGQKLIEIISGPTLSLFLLGTYYDTRIILTQYRWYHVVWTWSHATSPISSPCPTCGKWQLYLDSQLRQTSNTIRGVTKHVSIGGASIPGSGRLLLGQATPDQNNQFSTEKSFDGSLAYVNLWNEQLNADRVMDLFNDCQSYLCGNLVQWTAFRAGTRGSARIRWPIKIDFDPKCYQEESSAAACEEYCQIVHGRFCPNFVDSNVLWHRTVEGNYSVEPCPGTDYTLRGAALNLSSAGVAARLCERNPTQPSWSKKIDFQKCRMPFFEQLLTELQRAVNRQELHQGGQGNDVMHVTPLDFLKRFLNFTENSVGVVNSPVDIASMIEILRLICRLQEYAVTRVVPSRRAVIYPSFENTVDFGKNFTEALEMLAGPKCEKAWNGVLPIGSEANNMYRLLDQFLQLVVESFKRHLRNGEASLSNTVLRVVRSSMVVKVQVVGWMAFRGFAMPDITDSQDFNVDSSEGALLLPRESFDSLNLTIGDVYLGISSVRFDAIGKHLPNHNVDIKSKFNNINSAVMTFKLHDPNIEPYANFSIPFTVKLKYIDNFNISSPNCARLLNKEKDSRARETGKDWSWTQAGCTLKEFTTTTATCMCHNQGHFALTTNMFDPDWNKEQEPPPLLNVASYIGLSFGFICVTASVIVLNYYGTYSTTASIHKHFGFALAMAKLSLMVGIELYRYNQLSCRVFTVLNHFFFTACFSWLLNEGVNMYIMVTYSAHSKSQQAEQEGPQWKYYIIGWIMPMISVGTLCGVHGDDYYAPNMCWVNWRNMWVFLGPVIAVLAVNVLILTFALKEHHETAYTKNEKANKIIGTHMKAIWTQLILLSSDWIFAFLSIRMLGHVIKILFMIVTTLQGSFFLIFYVLLNDEVRRLRAERLRELEQREDEQRRSLEDLLAAAVIGKDSMVVRRGGNTNESVRIAIKSRRKSDDEEESTTTDLRGRNIENSDSD